MTENKIKYFKDYWDELTLKIETSHSSIVINSPRKIFLEIIEEVKLNNFKIKRYNDIYIKNLKILSEIHLDYINILQPELIILKKELNRKNQNIIIYLCEKILQKFRNHEFVNENINCLCQILFSDEEFTKEEKSKLQIIINHIVSEFIEEGFSGPYVISILDRLFSGYKQISDKILLTEFPYDKIIKTDNIIDIEQHNKTIKEFIDSLDNKTRVNHLKTIIQSQPERFIYIFQVVGLQGRNKIELEDIVFYNPGTDHISDEDSIKILEKFGQVNNFFQNVAVTYTCRDRCGGVEIAKETALQALDFVTFGQNREKQIRLGESYIILRKEDKSIAQQGFNKCSNNANDSYFQSHIIKDEFINSNNYRLLYNCHKYSLSDSSKAIYKQISESLHWHRKAYETQTNADKILWFWISIENLIQKSQQEENWIFPKGETERSIDIAAEIISRIQSKINLYSKTWNLFREIQRVILEDKIQLPKEHLKLYIVNNNTPVLLNDFLESLKIIYTYIPESLFLDRILYLINTYSSSNNIVNEILNDMQANKEKIVLFYRMRNRIVHNAFFSSQLLSFHSQSAGMFSLIFIIYILRKIQEQQLEDMPSLISSLYVDFELFIQSLKSNPPVEVLSSPHIW